MKSIAIIVIAMMLTGCGAFRQLTWDAVQEEHRWVKLIKKVSTVQIKDWPTWGGFIRGALEPDEMPLKLMKALDELDTISKVYVDKEGIPDSKFAAEYMKGYFVAKKFRSSVELVIHLIRQYAPGLLGAMESLAKLI